MLPATTHQDPTRPGLEIRPLGYGYADGTQAPYVAGYFSVTERRCYDFHDQAGQGRGMSRVTRDALGAETTLTYDPYDLLPVRAVDGLSLAVQAAYNYRVFQPHQIVDCNGNRTAYGFTSLGLLESIAVQGKAQEAIGDTSAAGTRFVYDFQAFDLRGAPISVRTLRRAFHSSQTEVPLPERDDTLEKMEFTDGFGRLMQTRTQAEDVQFGPDVFAGGEAQDLVGLQHDPGDPPSVLVSGWQVYDNKGRVVEKYEPFFSTGWDPLPPREDQLGQKTVIFYDPRGHIVRTLHPAGSEDGVVDGVPWAIAVPDLSNPDVFEPTPWETYTYDANDNAGRTHPAVSASYQTHWNTPTSRVIDALGRTVATVQRNGPNPTTDVLTTVSTYDIQGNTVVVTDPLNRKAVSFVYDLLKRPLYTEHLDAGVRWVVRAALGNMVEKRSSKGT